MPDPALNPEQSFESPADNSLPLRRELPVFELPAETLEAISGDRDLLHKEIFDLVRRSGHSLELVHPLNSGTFSNTLLVRFDGAEVAMKVLGGDLPLAMGLLTNPLALDVPVLEARTAMPILGCPDYFGKVVSLESSSPIPKVLAYFKEYIDGTDSVTAVRENLISEEDLFTAIREIVAERINLGFHVWDMNISDFFLRTDSENLPLRDRIVLVDPATPPMSAHEGAIQESVETVMADFESCLRGLLAKSA